MSRNIIGLDIGTSNIKIYSRDQDTILNEKNIIAIANKKDVYAFGDEAFEMHEKAPDNINVSFPVKYGVIADFDNMPATKAIKDQKQKEEAEQVTLSKKKTRS